MIWHVIDSQVTTFMMTFVTGIYLGVLMFDTAMPM
jgi:hypothetical protein